MAMHLIIFVQSSDLHGISVSASGYRMIIGTAVQAAATLPTQ
jgi:hypothetical protein